MGEVNFAATKQVRSMAPMSPVICDVGDTVTVEGWYCRQGPTVIDVNGEKHCIPFGWVQEAGFPAEMESQIEMK